MNWLTSKLHSSISLLEKLKISLTDSYYETIWSTSKLQSSNSLLEKVNFWQIDPVWGIIWLPCDFRAQIAGSDVSILSQTDPVYELDEILQNFIYQIACLKKIRLFRIWFSLKINLNCFLNLWSSHSLFRNWNFFRNWFCLWNFLECLIIWIACRKNSNFWRAIQYMKRLDKFQISKAQKACLRKRKMFAK